jgi:hypothetical protein
LFEAVLILASLVMSIVALRRSRDVSDLARRVRQLEAQLTDLLSSRHARAVSEPPAEAKPEMPSEQPPAADAPPIAGPEPRPASPPPPPRPPVAIDWERWLGVRGAAVLGGIALASAGMLFFRYSIEHGLISPSLRVILGTLAGLSCVAAPQLRWRKDYPDAANALSGAGLVILYASFWAARNLYGLIGIGTAFGLMALVTSAGCLLALRDGSMLVAVLGLVGGFATPFLVSSHADHPIGLFGYILLLDLALLVISRRRGWPWLAALSLAGTVLYQAFWIGFRMHPDRLLLALGVLALFALLYALAAPRRSEGDFTWRATQGSGVLVPFGFALYFAARADLGPRFYPIAGLLLLLSASASWIDRRRGDTALGPSAAGAVTAVVAAWLVSRPFLAPLGWEAVASSLGLALLFHAFAEERRKAPGWAGATLAGTIAAGGMQLVFIAASLRFRDVSIWPWVATWLALTALLVRQGTGWGREVLQPLAWASLGLALGLLHVVHGAELTFPALPSFFAVLLVIVALSHVAALVQEASAGRDYGEHAAALLSVILLLSLPVMLQVRPAAPEAFLGGSLALGFLAVLAATRLGSGEWYFAAMAATAIAHTAWSGSPHAIVAGLSAPFAELFAEAAAVALFTGWPLWGGPRLRAQRFAWYASALAGPAWFWSLRRLFVLSFGDHFIGILPLSLGALSLLTLYESRTLWPDSDPMRRRAVVWFSAIALGFVSVAIPLQLEKEWITVGWALEVLALAMLWKRLDHPGLKLFAVALTVAVTLRLVVNDAVLGYHARPTWRIVNWLAYTYLIPAASLAAAATIFNADELRRARSWEGEVYRHGFAVAASLMGLAAIAIAFVWINLAIADWFSTGQFVALTFHRVPAQNLTTSIAWALYALVLLALGVARSLSGLRWVSLLVLILTIGKVFLYDLGELQDLFRVVSLLGLAISLIVVSLAYQRFVFRKLPAEGP